MFHANAPNDVALTYDELIFQKAYSTFDLRQRYRPTLTRALGLGVGLFLLATVAFAQQTKPDSQQTVWVHDDMREAQFPGGPKALIEYVRRNVRYPDSAARAKITGKVFVSFVIDTAGNASNFNVLKGLGYGCDEEALRVARSLPRWTPSTKSGKPIWVKYNLPVLFGLDYPKSKSR